MNHRSQTPKATPNHEAIGAKPLSEMTAREAATMLMLMRTDEREPHRTIQRATRVCAALSIAPDRPAGELTFMQTLAIVAALARAPDTAAAEAEAIVTELADVLKREAVPTPSIGDLVRAADAAHNLKTQNALARAGAKRK